MLSGTRSFLGETPGEASRGDGESLSPEMPKNETAKVQLCGRAEPLAPLGGFLLAQLGGSPLQFVPTLLEPHAAELDLSLLFWVLLLPILLSHTQTCVCPLSWGPAHPEGLLCCGHFSGGLRAWWFYLKQVLSPP